VLAVRAPSLVLLLAALAPGCGGHSEAVGRTPECVDGDCDAGPKTRAVMRPACRGVSEVQLLGEFPLASAFGRQVAPTRLRGRDYLIQQTALYLPVTETRLLDLATLTESVVTHEPGHATCSGDPAWCWVRQTGGGTLITGLRLDQATGRWDAAQATTFDNDGIALPSDAEVASGRLVFQHWDRIQVFDTETAELLFEIEPPAEHRFDLPVTDVDGSIAGFFTSRRQPLEIGLVGVEPGASWRLIHRDDEFDYVAAFRRAADWFVLRDDGSEGLSVRRASASGGGPVHSFANRFWFAGSSSDLARASDDLAFHGVSCDGTVCTLFRVQLDPFGVQAFTSVESSSPGPRWIDGATWEECGAAQLIVQSSYPVAPDEVNRVWAIRLVPLE
jgi:hypothetical protein